MGLCLHHKGSSSLHMGEMCLLHNLSLHMTIARIEFEMYTRVLAYVDRYSGDRAANGAPSQFTCSSLLRFLMSDQCRLRWRMRYTSHVEAAGAFMA